mgnify:CR=1 FL=1
MVETREIPKETGAAEPEEDKTQFQRLTERPEYREVIPPSALSPAHVMRLDAILMKASGADAEELAGKGALADVYEWVRDNAALRPTDFDALFRGRPNSGIEFAMLYAGAVGELGA